VLADRERTLVLLEPLDRLGQAVELSRDVGRDPIGVMGNYST
jgi:hypothetical protein